MDPLTELSVAGTILQFVEFGSSVLKNGTEIFLPVSEEIELVTMVRWI
jgi:hypothetical protein